MPRLTDLDRAHPRSNIKMLFRKTKLQHCFGCKTLQLFQARSLSQLPITDTSAQTRPHSAPGSLSHHTLLLASSQHLPPSIVSFACTDHGLKAPRNGEHSKQNATSPNTTSHARARFRTVALIARSLGSFTHRYHHNLKESTAKLTGMKYRYVTW
ncbi:hypothetical protein GOODEAATRI_004627 [Goodea atripinnis]|uniref:Uncharacterized protein n=1 Tax=Goodea atripinnis TaxID=208336 RepID=A0ABV0P4Z9_9TELE